MGILKPWVDGPYELIRHGNQHLETGGDFDKRLALISYDNAIELAITSFLKLDPLQRDGRSFPKDKVASWLTNYHTKLEFFYQEFLPKPSAADVMMDEVIWCHRHRNELYHSGNGLVPDARVLHLAQKAASWITSTLFNVSLDPDVDGETSLSSEKLEPGHLEVPSPTSFLTSFIEFEKTLLSVIRTRGIEDHKNRFLFDVEEAWLAFTSHCGAIPERYEEIVQEAMALRRSLLREPAPESPQFALLRLSSQLDQVSTFVGSYFYSLDILTPLKNKYGGDIKPDIISTRIINKDDGILVETVVKTIYYGERADRVDVTLAEYIDDNGEWKAYFDLERTAEENAEILVEEVSPCDLADMAPQLFTPEGFSKWFDS